MPAHRDAGAELEMDIQHQLRRRQNAAAAQLPGKAHSGDARLRVYRGTGGLRDVAAAGAGPFWLLRRGCSRRRCHLMLAARSTSLRKRSFIDDRKSRTLLHRSNKTECPQCWARLPESHLCCRELAHQHGRCKQRQPPLKSLHLNVLMLSTNHQLKSACRRTSVTPSSLNGRSMYLARYRPASQTASIWRRRCSERSISKV